MSLTTEQVSSWLQFGEPAKFQTETYEYSMQGPLYAASAVLTRRTISPDRRLLECRVSARYPIRKKKEFEVRAETDAKGTLIIQEENDLITGEQRIWRIDSPAVLSLDGVSAINTSGPVQSVVGILFAISDFLSLNCDSIPITRTMAVVGKKIWALRLLSLKSSATGIEAEITRLDTHDGRVNIESAEWNSAYRLRLEWDASARLIQAIQVSLPIVGRIKIQLVRHERK